MQHIFPIANFVTHDKKPDACIWKINTQDTNSLWSLDFSIVYHDTNGYTKNCSGRSNYSFARCIQFLRFWLTVLVQKQFVSYSSNFSVPCWYTIYFYTCTFFTCSSPCWIPTLNLEKEIKMSLRNVPCQRIFKPVK